ncbi:MAG: CpsD/CapB family tyrosine-protein kinase, partial [Paracoccaceae bacterium]
MAEKGEPPSRRDRTTSVSVFRPGRKAERDTDELDRHLCREIFSDAYPLALFNPSRVWESLNSLPIDAHHLAGNGLFTEPDQSPAGSAFDILRTRISQAMQDRGWRRIGITSPTHGCGKSFTAANLALALARRPDSRVVLIDLDLRRPGLHTLFGASSPGALRDFLDGSQPMESRFLRVGKTLAVAFNGEAMPDASDILHSANTAQALDAMETQLDPEITVMDLPPILVSDDVLAMKGKVDAVLIVADGTQTTAKDIRACEALLDKRIPLMGVVLNRAQDHGLGRLQ